MHGSTQRVLRALRGASAARVAGASRPQAAPIHWCDGTSLGHAPPPRRAVRLRCLRDTPTAAGGRARDALATPAHALASPHAGGRRPAGAGRGPAALSRAPRARAGAGPGRRCARPPHRAAASASAARPPSPPHPADARPGAVRGAAHPERRPAAPLRPRSRARPQDGRASATDGRRAARRVPLPLRRRLHGLAGRAAACRARAPRSIQRSPRRGLPLRRGHRRGRLEARLARAARHVAPHLRRGERQGALHAPRRDVAQLQRPPLRGRPFRLLARLSLVGRGDVRPRRRHDRLDLSQRMARAPLRVGARERPARVGQSVARGRQAPAICRSRGTRDPGGLRVRSA